MPPNKESMTREQYNAYMRAYRERVKAERRVRIKKEYDQIILTKSFEYKTHGLKYLVSMMQMPQFRSKPVPDQDRQIKICLDALEQQVQGFIIELSKGVQDELTASEVEFDRILDEAEPKLFAEYQAITSVHGVLPEIDPDLKGFIRKIDVFKREGLGVV